MSMMGMDEIGEYQRMMECGGALLGATHAADGADMAFGNAAAAELQVGHCRHARTSRARAA